MSGIGVILSKREEIGKEPTFSAHFFLYSDASATVETLMKQKRGRRAIENQLHWMLDVIYREDDGRARIQNAAENLNILRKLSFQLMKQDITSKGKHAHQKTSLRLRLILCLQSSRRQSSFVSDYPAVYATVNGLMRRMCLLQLMYSFYIMFKKRVQRAFSSGTAREAR